ncbi:hypothetical protein [Nocardia sp. NPDC047648]|uniref:hypothetical protein n=1 Tax=Nocardia sp. NPDC047648 TaxID=3155625 RepID=UPI0033CC4FCE
MTARPVTPICARAVEVGINQLSSFDRAARPRETVRRLHRGVRSTTLQTLLTRPAAAGTEGSASRASRSPARPEVEFHLRRLDVGGTDPALTAMLLAQAVEAQIHGAVLDPPLGRTADECGRAVVDLWTRALTPPADPARPAAGS